MCPECNIAPILSLLGFCVHTYVRLQLQTGLLAKAVKIYFRVICMFSLPYVFKNVNIFFSIFIILGVVLLL